LDPSAVQKLTREKFFLPCLETQRVSVWALAVLAESQIPLADCGWLPGISFLPAPQLLPVFRMRIHIKAVPSFQIGLWKADPDPDHCRYIQKNTTFIYLRESPQFSSKCLSDSFTFDYHSLQSAWIRIHVEVFG
jgi:hypothetical protein